jgi:zinc protease
MSPGSADPPLFTVAARVKKLDDTIYVRDEILRTFAKIRADRFPDKTVADAISNNRYALARTFDNTDEIASTLARFVRYNRSYDTLNQLYRTAATVTADDLLAAARKYVVDGEMVVTTLSKDPMPAAMGTLPALTTFAAPAAAADLSIITQNPALPQVVVKLAFKQDSTAPEPDKDRQTDGNQRHQRQQRHPK